jgi:hypothetical protein
MHRLWRGLRRFLKWSGFAAAALVALAVAFFALAFAINARDEELSPQARALLTPPANPYRAEDNIYLALVGSGAPAGQPVIAAGLDKVAEYERGVDAAIRDEFDGATADQRESKAVRFVHTLTDARLAFKGDCGFLQPLGEPIWRTAPQHRSQIRQLLTDNHELYVRYLALRNLSGYYETARPTVFASMLGGWETCPRRLFLGEYVQRMRSGNPAEKRQALEDLQSDRRLWTTVFSGEGTLVSKMVAIVNLEGDYLAFADTIADPSIDMPLGEQDADSFAPVSPVSDWDLGSAFAAEFRVTSADLDSMARGSAFAMDDEAQSLFSRGLRRLWVVADRQCFKLNDTLNLLAVQRTRLIHRARDPRIFFAEKAPGPAVGWQPDIPTGLRALMGLLTYNPGGRLFARMADATYGGTYDDYPLRAWDAAALQRLVRLSYEIRRQHVQKSAIPDFLEQHPEWSTHPADGRPFLWNAETGELRVQTVGKQPPERRFWVRVWQSPG